jgi:hypothetical protein
MQFLNSSGKYQEPVMDKKLEFKSVHENGTLFEVDTRLAVRGFCPLCLRRLYPMMNKPLYWCKNKQHKRFVIAKSKIIL